MSATIEKTKSDLRSAPGASFISRLLHQFQKDDVTGIAAESAYFWIFAIPPMMILIVMVGALVDDFTSVSVVNNLRSQIDSRAPADTASVLNRLIDNGVAQISGGAASFGVIFAALLALWSGSNAMAVLIKAFNRSYNIDEARPYVHKRGLAILLTLLLVGILNGAFIILVYGHRIGLWIADKIGAGSEFEQVWGYARLPLALAGIILVLMLLYKIGPNVDQSVRNVLPGAIAATGLWLLATAGFGIYLRFSNPGSAYGVLGSVIILLFFLYLTAIILVLGAEINVVIRKEQPENSSSQQSAASD